MKPQLQLMPRDSEWLVRWPVIAAEVTTDSVEQVIFECASAVANSQRQIHISQCQLESRSERWGASITSLNSSLPYSLQMADVAKIKPKSNNVGG